MSVWYVIENRVPYNNTVILIMISTQHAAVAFGSESVYVYDIIIALIFTVFKENTT